MSRNVSDLYCVATAISRVGCLFLENQREALWKHAVTSSILKPVIFPHDAPVNPPGQHAEAATASQPTTTTTTHEHDRPESLNEESLNQHQHQQQQQQQQQPIEPTVSTPNVEPTMSSASVSLGADVHTTQEPDITLKAEQLEAISNKDTYDAIIEEPLEQRKALKESRIPTTRAGRLWHYGTLAAGLGVGAMNESFKRATGLSKNAQGSAMLSDRNVDLLVNKISQMRGAALKMGQMLSIQGIQAASDKESWIPPQMEQILLKVHDSANYMPQKQMEAVMRKGLGGEWKTHFSKFDPVPIAAASIGQVHAATLASTGEDVVIKVQYPGVAQSIDSDLNNLMAILTFSNLLPRGLYLDNTVRVTRQELAWECDYLREAANTQRYGDLISGDERYKVPRVYHDMCSSNILVLERLRGRALSKAVNEDDQGLRDRLGERLLRLCLREVFSFQFMQTDPNWSNFFYNPNRNQGQLELLDFGACRPFGDDFLALYGQILKAAAHGDRDGVWHYSEKLGFVTGLETAVMREAHIDSVMVLGEPFRADAPDLFDFGVQTITGRVRDTIPVMLRHRLTPPPDETYGLHKKLSGAFLLCTKLRSRFNTKAVWQEEVERVFS